MVFREPVVEFIEIKHEDTIATTGASYAICENTGENAMPIETFCAMSTETTSKDWETVCGMIEPGMAH